MTDITVLVRHDWLKSIPDVVARLERAGMTIDRVQDQLGIVSGSALHSALRGIEGLEGVMAVEEERVIQLPDPESDLQ